MTSSSRTKHITVGVDGSTAGLRALNWAAADALREGCTLRLVHAYQPATRKSPGLPASTRVLAYENGKRILAAARRHLATGPSTGLELTSELCEGPASSVLIDDARQSLRLVVGSRGRGALAALAVGSTSLACAARSATPVIVVPHGWQVPQRRDRHIVVGVDGTEHCEAAVGYAFDYGLRHGLELVAVMGWDLANPYARDASTRTEQLRAGKQAAEERLDATLAAWRVKYPAVTVRTAAIHLPPLTALVEQSQGADLLVVGGRLPGRVRGRILSSVTRGVLRHTTTPVAVVRS